jgi:CspA family cold shock protein
MKMTGTVRRFNAERGFGFITGEDEQTYFVHQTKILMSGYRTLEIGQKVTFDPDETDRGPQAINVTPLD